MINNGATVTCNGYNEFGSGSYVPVTINAGGQLLRNSPVFGTRLGSLTLAGGTLGVLTCEGAGGQLLVRRSCERHRRFHDQRS